MRWVVPWCLVAVVVAGCGEDEKRRPPWITPEGVTGRPRQIRRALQNHADDKAKSSQPPSTDALQRKIIYTATVNLVVEHFDPIPAQVEALVNRFGAYVARSQITGSPGSPRHGQWTLRVPAERYEAFLAAAREIGEVQNVSSDSQDVTEEYYDVEAHIRNKKQEETRLLELLSKATGKLEEVLAVERELARVRGEIEQMEGRLRVLSNLTTMSTVNLESVRSRITFPRRRSPTSRGSAGHGRALPLHWLQPHKVYRFCSWPCCPGSASFWYPPR